MIATCFVAVLPFVTTWVVDANNGPGTHFTDLPQAVAAAQDGDTILVRSGTYAAFTVSNKGLTIRGAGAATTIVAQPTIGAMMAGQVVYLSGLHLQSPLVPASWLSGALEAQARSRVVLVDCELIGRAANGTGHAGLLVLGGEVHATRCLFRGGDGTGFGVLSQNTGGTGAIVNSTIYVGATLEANDCRFEGGVGQPNAFNQVGGGQGLSGYQTYMTLRHCSCVGGAAMAGTASYGGQALGVAPGTYVRVVGDTGDQFRAGASATGGHSVGIAVSSTSMVVIHGPVVVAGSTAAGPATTGAVVTGAWLLPKLSIRGTPKPSGELLASAPVQVDLDGLFANGLYVYAVGVAPAMVANIDPAIGELLVAWPPAVLQVGLLDAAGHLIFAFVPASAPALLDVPLYTQAGVFAPTNGRLLLSNCEPTVFSL